MKNLFLLCLMLPFFAAGQNMKLSKREKREIAAAGAAKHYKIPVSEKTDKISYSGTMAVDASEERLYKRALQFIAFQNWDKTITIKCKNAMPVSAQIIENAITYDDAEDGVLIGNGYTRYPMREATHFILTFKYKIAADEGAYKYEFTDFEVLEFVSGERTKGKSTGVAYGGIASGSGQTRFYDIDVRTYPMEEFVDYIGYYERFIPELHYNFKEITKRLVNNLSDVMEGE